MLKIACSCMLLSFILSDVCSQSVNFVDVTALPEARSATSSANDGQNIYITNGFGPGVQFSSEIYQYNTTADEWSLLTDMTVQKRFASTAYVDEKLYVFNGELSGNGVNEQLEIIDVKTGEVTTGSANPNPVRAGGVAVWGNNFYAFGGNSFPGVYATEIYVYNTVSQEWTLETNMPEGMETKGEIVNGKLYIIGGYNGQVADQIFTYDLVNQVWESPITLNTGISANGTAVLDSKIYLTGDFVNQTFLAYYDTADKTFVELDGNLMARRHHSSEGVGGRLYVIGGSTESDVNSSIKSVQATGVIANITAAAAREIEIYPNPAQEIIYFDLPIEQLTIYNLWGQIIYREKSSTQFIDISEFANGWYLLKGVMDNQPVTTKWIKGK